MSLGNTLKDLAALGLPGTAATMTSSIKTTHGIPVLEANQGRYDPLRPDLITVTATANVKSNAGYLLSLKVVSGSSITVVLYDQTGTGSTGYQIASYAGLNVGDEFQFPGSGYPFINGLYAAITGTGTVVLGVM